MAAMLMMRNEYLFWGGGGTRWGEGAHGDDAMTTGSPPRQTQAGGTEGGQGQHHGRRKRLRSAFWQSL